MKLFMLPPSPFVRKARIIIHELGLTRMVEEVQADLADRTELRKVNPLGKIPALVLDDGSILVDSPVICEYLDDLGGGKFFPKPNIWGDSKGRWKALTLQALGDGICDAAVAHRLETMRPAEQQSSETRAKHMTAITLTLDVLERQASRFAEAPTIGEISVGCALGYLDFRFADVPWREGRPQLASWFGTFEKMSSMQATKP